MQVIVLILLESGLRLLLSLKNANFEKLLCLKMICSNVQIILDWALIFMGVSESICLLDTKNYDLLSLPQIIPKQHSLVQGWAITLLGGCLITFGEIYQGLQE